MRFFERFWKTAREAPGAQAGAAGDEEPYRDFTVAWRHTWKPAYVKIVFEGFDPVTAEDVLQEVALRLHKRIQKNNGEVPCPALPVVLGMVTDEVKMARRTKRRRHEGGEVSDDIPASKPSQEQRLGDAEWRKNTLDAIFSQMRPDDVALLKMAHTDLTLAQMAALRGSNVAAVGMALKRARERFVEFGRCMYDLEKGSEGK